MVYKLAYSLDRELVYSVGIEADNFTDAVDRSFNYIKETHGVDLRVEGIEGFSLLAPKRGDYVTKY